VYINSTFLEQFVPATILGLVYTTGAILSLIVISITPSFLKRHGLTNTATTVLSIDILAMLVMSYANFMQPHTAAPIFFAIGGFLTFSAAIVLNRICLDAYLEEFSSETKTGNIRGIYLTAVNSAFVLAPLAVGLLMRDSEFWRVYSISAVFLCMAVCVLIGKLSHVKVVRYHVHPFLKTARTIFKSNDIFNIFASSFLLEFFYTWMVIYSPLYLSQTVGFGWEDIGKMFSIMLTAFVIFQLPMGKIADKYLGEKEILTAGYIIMGLATATIFFIESQSFWTWAAVLFLTRVGASFVEVMNETYFFKKVKASDADIISFFRNAQPLAILIGPLVASAILVFLPVKSLFLILGVVMIAGTKFSLAITDTK
jgi:MFS family permease